MPSRVSRPNRGLVYCVLAPVAYTAYNLLLRGVSDKQDSAWITCVQASVGVAVFGAYLGWRTGGGRRVLPSWKELLSLLMIGLVAQIGGVLMVWAMGVIGVGVTATLQMGVMLAGTAVLGRIVLGERVSWEQAAAIAMIVVAVLLFSRGAQSASETAAIPIAADKVLLGIAAGIASGLAFAVLMVGVRKTVTGDTSPEAVVFLISLAGVVFLGPWCLVRLGFDTLVQTPTRHLGVMLAAGAVNLLGFLLVTKALQVVAAVRVNAVNNALTMTLTVIAGIVIFAEPWNGQLLLGIILSITAVVLMSFSGEAKTAAPSASESPDKVLDTR